jgi:hypothetical protein
MPNHSRINTTGKRTATRASAVAPRPGSGSISPRLSAKARVLTEKNRALKSEVARLKDAAESEIRKRHRVEDELSRFGGARVQRDDFAQTRRFVVEINEHEARSARHGAMVYELAIKRLIESLHEHSLASAPGLAEQFAKAETGKMQKKLRARAIMDALGITYENVQVVHEMRGAIHKAIDPSGRFFSPEAIATLRQLAELLNLGVDVIMTAHYERK